MQSNKPFAEVIESSLQRWLCQSWQWDIVPSFGSLIAIKDTKRTIIGVVHQVQTGSMDPVRYPFPYQKTEDELKKEQPQIFEFLKTTFTCLTVGYLEKGKMIYQLTPEPPKIHAFAELLSTESAKQFLHHHHYLPLLCSMSNEVFNLDELLLALIKHQHELKTLNADSINHFINSYTLMYGQDYRRIKVLLRRVQMIMQ